VGVKDDFYRGWGGCGEHFGGEGGIFYVVEGEATPVRGTVEGIMRSGFRNGIQVTGGNAGLEDEVFVGLGDAATVVDDD